MKCGSADKTASKTISSQHPIITARTPSQTKSEKSGILKSDNGTQADGLSDTGTIVPIAVGVAVAVLIVVVIVIAVVMMRKNKRGAG